jgi:hypothetical protein
LATLLTRPQLEDCGGHSPAMVMRRARPAAEIICRTPRVVAGSRSLFGHLRVATRRPSPLGFLTLLGATLASADTFEARVRFGRFIGMVSGEENTFFLRAFELSFFEAAYLDRT